MKKFLIACLLILFSPFFTFNFAYADEVKLTSNFKSGQWTNENVILSFTGPAKKAFYSFDQNEWIEMVDLCVTFEEEMQSTIYLKALDANDNLLLQTSFIVNIDKTPPSNLLVFGIPTTFTSNDVEIIVTATDGVEYSFFNDEFSYKNKCILTQNTIFKKSDIRARDRAGNIVSNSYEIIVDKIDKKEPKFYVLTNNSSKKQNELVRFEVEPIISGIKNFYYTFNGKDITNITQDYENGIYLSENGEYEFVLESNVGKIYKVKVKFENLGTEINPWLRNGILIFSFLVFLVFFVWTVVLHKTNKINKKN